MNVLGGLAIALFVAAIPEAIGHVWEWIFGPSKIKERHIRNMKLDVPPPKNNLAYFHTYGRWPDHRIG